ncbi:MAG: energy transducer TonB family protein [Bdellovibrionota bacterium]
MACMILLYQQAAKWAPKHHEWVELDPTLLQQLKKKEELQKNSQIVQTQLTKKSEKAADKAYLGQQTQIVDIQTVSKKLDQVIGKATAKSSSQSKQQEQARKEAKANSKPLANLGLTMIPPQTKTVQPDEPHWANVGSVGGDYVKGFKESDRTALNTVEYVYFSYMQRIRERFELAWRPLVREKIVRYYNNGRKLASDFEHKTDVLVTLNDTGEVTKIQVLAQSGTQELDEAAVEAFNKAGPFPNPPRGLLDPRGFTQVRWAVIIR